MDLDDLISRYIDGELDSQAEAELHHRLSVSPEARSALRSHTALREASRDTRILDTPSPALHAALFNRLQQDEGMARAAAAAVVPAEALAAPRREAVPSEMHKPGRRVRRRRTALWFALPMVLLATILANEFLIVENKETKQLAERVRQNIEQPAPALAPSAPSGTAAAPSAESETTMKLDLKDADATSVPYTASEPAPHNGLVPTSNGTSSNGPVRSLATVSRATREGAALDYRAIPTDDVVIASASGGSEGGGYEESIVNTLNDGSSILEAARAADRSRREERSMRVMSPSEDMMSVQVVADSVRAPLVSLNRNSVNSERARSPMLASGALAPKRDADNDEVSAASAPPPPPEPVQIQQNSLSYQNFNQSTFSTNQISAPEMNLAQRSNYLADSSLRRLVQKDTTISRAKTSTSRKAAKLRARRSTRHR